MTKLDAALAAKLCAEFLGYADRFGITAEVVNGAIPESNLRALAEQLMAALEAVKERDETIELFRLADTDALAERDRLRAELDRLNKYIATHDEEYATMKETLRAEHQECQRLRADLAATLKAKEEACDLFFTTPEQIAAGFNPEARIHALRAIGKDGGK